MDTSRATVEVRLTGGLETWKDGLWLAPAAVGTNLEAEPANPHVVFRAMGCTVRAEVASLDPRAQASLDQVSSLFETWEARLTRFRPDSELSQLNARAGEAVPVSPVLWDVIQASIRAAKISAGLVTPLVLQALQAAGYDRPFDELRGEDHPPSLGPAPVADWRKIVLDPAARTVRLPQAARLDLGGVGKGWAAEQAADQLKALGPVMVSAGGDIAFRGRRQASLPWKVTVADPRRPERDLTTLALRSGGVATSGTDYRRWTSGGVRQHHLIDPRTGAPSESDVLSATVVAPSLQLAEVAAKVAILLGSREGLTWIERRPGLAALIVLEDGGQLESERLAQYLWRE
jgi:thiamine biosynthesis lipoprotein